MLRDVPHCYDPHCNDPHCNEAGEMSLGNGASDRPCPRPEFMTPANPALS